MSVVSKPPIHSVGIEGPFVWQNQTVSAINDPNGESQRKTQLYLLCSKRRDFKIF